MIDFSSNVQHLEERITELQHVCEHILRHPHDMYTQCIFSKVLSAEFEKNAHLQSKLNEYEEVSRYCRYDIMIWGGGGGGNTGT